MIMKMLSVECERCGWKRDVSDGDDNWKETVELELCPQCVDRDIEPPERMGEV